MRFWPPFPLAGLLILSSAAAQMAAPASEEERLAAANAVFTCLEAAIPKVEDHRSDAATIAVAAASMCEGLFMAMDDAYQRQESYAVRRKLAESTQAEHNKIALRSVLSYRNRRPKGR